MKFIQKLIDKQYITSAEWRMIEIFLLWAIISLLLWVLDNVDVIINGWIVDWMTFIKVFVTTTALSISAWLKKKLRDEQAELLNSIDYHVVETENSPEWNKSSTI